MFSAMSMKKYMDYCIKILTSLLQLKTNFISTDKSKMILCLDILLTLQPMTVEGDVVVL